MKIFKRKGCVLFQKYHVHSKNHQDWIFTKSKWTMKETFILCKIVLLTINKIISLSFSLEPLKSLHLHGMNLHGCISFNGCHVLNYIKFAMNFQFRKQESHGAKFDEYRKLHSHNPVFHQRYFQKVSRLLMKMCLKLVLIRLDCNLDI